MSTRLVELVGNGNVVEVECALRAEPGEQVGKRALDGHAVSRCLGNLERGSMGKDDLEGFDRLQ